MPPADRQLPAPAPGGGAPGGGAPGGGAPGGASGAGPGWWHRWWTSPGKVVLLIAGATALSAVAGIFATGWYGQFDLRIYYDAMAAWHAGDDLYGYAQPDRVMGDLGFTYPPLAALLMWPMALLPFEAVRVITLAAIVAACWLLARLLLADARWRSGGAAALALLLVPLAFALEPLRQNLSYGQINIFLAALVVLDLVVLQRRGSAWFGVGIGLATAIKLTPGIFCLYLLVTGRWRALGVSAATAALTTVAAAALTWQQSWDYFTTLLWDSTRVGRPEAVADQSLQGLLARFFVPEKVPTPVWAACVAVVLGVGLWRARRLWTAGDDVAGMSIVGLVGLCVSPISWFHHAVWVFPALLVLGHRWWQLRGDPGRPATCRWLAAFWLAAAVPLLLQPDVYIRVPPDAWAQANWLVSLAAGLPTLAFCLLIAVLPARADVGPGAAGPPQHGQQREHRQHRVDRGQP